jgi:hypothetical protein
MQYHSPFMTGDGLILNQSVVRSPDDRSVSQSVLPVLMFNFGIQLIGIFITLKLVVLPPLTSF